MWLQKYQELTTGKWKRSPVPENKNNELNNMRRYLHDSIDAAEPVVVHYEEMRAYDVASQYMSIQKTKNRKKKNRKTKYGW